MHGHELQLWRSSCKVTLELEYSFGAGLLGRAVAPVSNRGQFVDRRLRGAPRSLYGGGDV